MAKIMLAHISDLHFDGEILNSRSINLPHRQGHDDVLTTALMTALEDLPFDCESEEAVNVLVSGDLTRTGTDSQYAVAHTLLLDKARITLVAPPELLGYEIPENHFLSVPGNHDQYAAGGPMPAYNPSLAGVRFEVTPWYRRIVDSEIEVFLDIFGIDTNSGRIALFPTGWNLPAWGAISDQQFTDLEQLLQDNPPAPRRTVRAIAMHHSIQYRGGRIRTPISSGALLPKSRRRLLQICADYDIAAVMTGHTHDMYCNPPLTTTTSRGRSYMFHELRSPSTLAQKQKTNGFLVHEVSFSPERRQVLWETYHYPWKSPKFSRDSQPAARFWR